MNMAVGDGNAGELAELHRNLLGGAVCSSPTGRIGPGSRSLLGLSALVLQTTGGPGLDFPLPRPILAGGAAVVPDKRPVEMAPIDEAGVPGDCLHGPPHSYSKTAVFNTAQVPYLGPCVKYLGAISYGCSVWPVPSLHLSAEGFPG